MLLSTDRQRGGEKNVARETQVIGCPAVALQAVQWDQIERKIGIWENIILQTSWSLNYLN
jgi:hypothetical protein